MRQLGIDILNKLKKDFPSEIEVLEKGMDVLVMSGELLKDPSSPYHKSSHALDDLLKASAEERRSITQIMLLIHSIETLKASRLLLLTGYIGRLGRLKGWRVSLGTTLSLDPSLLWPTSSLERLAEAPDTLSSELTSAGIRRWQRDRFAAVLGAYLESLP